MKSRLVTLLGLGLLLILVIFVYLNVDWYTYGDAVPPAISVEISTESPASIDDLIINETSVDGNPITLSGGEQVMISGMIETEIDRWWWSQLRFGSTEKMLKFAKSQEGKPRMILHFSLLSRSSFEPGYLIERAEANGVGVRASQFAKMKKTKNKTVTFQTEFNAPKRPGEYELRATLSEKWRKEMLPRNEYIVGSWQVRVESADD